MAREDSAGEVAVGCFLVILMMPVSILIRGFVLTKLWLWFVVPFGVMQITMWHALGLSIVIGLFAGVTDASDSSKSIGGVVVKSLIIVFGPLLLLLLGWIFHGMM